MCCKHYKESVNAFLGEQCDGSLIDIDSPCCENNAYTPCPVVGGCQSLKNYFWHGEEDIATFSSIGDNRWHASDPQNATNMFDDDLTSIWYAQHPVVTGPQRVDVTFKDPIDFEKLVIVKRKNVSYRKQYQNVCMSLDDVEISCTSDSYGSGADDTKESIIWTKSQEKVQKVSLQFKHKSKPAQVGDLKIYFSNIILMNAKWEEYSDWEICSATCGDGTQSRSRKCLGSIGNCTGDTTQTQVCNVGKCPFQNKEFMGDIDFDGDSESSGDLIFNEKMEW